MEKKDYGMATVFFLAIGTLIAVLTYLEDDVGLIPYLEPYIDNNFDPPHAILGFENSGEGTAIVTEVHPFVRGEYIPAQPKDGLRWDDVIRKSGIGWSWLRYETLAHDERIKGGEKRGIFWVIESQATSDAVRLMMKARQELEIVVCYCSVEGSNCGYVALNNQDIEARNGYCPSQSDIRRALEATAFDQSEPDVVAD